MKSVSIGGLRIHNVNMQQAVSTCLALIDSRVPAAVYTPNAEIAKNALDDQDFLALLNDGDLVVPDGAGVVLASKILGTPLQQKVAGVELAEQLIPRLAESGARLFLLGGKPGVADLAAKNLLERNPYLNICGTAHGYFNDEHSLVKEIKEAGTQVLFVCLGSPKQELFIHRNMSTCNALMLGLGGTVDVFAGTAQRAPSFFVRNHLEWLYRGATDLRRVRRLLKIPAFLFDILCIRLKGEQP